MCDQMRQYVVLIYYYVTRDTSFQILYAVFGRLFSIHTFSLVQNKNNIHASQHAKYQYLQSILKPLFECRQIEQAQPQIYTSGFFGFSNVESPQTAGVKDIIQSVQCLVLPCSEAFGDQIYSRKQSVLLTAQPDVSDHISTYILDVGQNALCARTGYNCCVWEISHILWVRLLIRVEMQHQYTGYKFICIYKQHYIMHNNICV
ncbi:Hypothetical_protein [Hexamita inflata]|uniref:Hypothetical_protein n=1 Tax=Hexamita inflata TaxID=28002 RepID=A0ABP1HX55_9EUKA